MKQFGLKSPAGMVLFLTWLLFGMYYVNRFNYSPMIPLLKVDLGITNTQAGWLMALFFISYTIFQLPAGFLGDRFGPRKVLTWGAIISITGNLIFSQATSLGILSLGQLVNGLGQSMGWTSSLKLIVSWFPRSQRATAIGFFATCVTAGSSFGIRLSGLLGDHLGWRSSFIIPPVLLAMVALFFWMMAKDSPRERGLPDFDDEIHLEKRIENDPRSRLSLVLTNRILWSVALVYFCFVYVQFGCLVWIPSFLKEAYAMSVDRASTISALVLLPGVFASPLAGFLSDHYFRGKRKPLILMLMFILALATFLLSQNVSITLAIGLLTIVGLMIIMPDVLLAAYPSDILSRKLSATGMGFLTTFTSIAGIITTPLSGKIIDLFDSYAAVFFSFAVAALAGALLTLCIREKTIYQSK
ncbi:MAG: MFS transporter [Desulfobacteraceae bacterium]|nr:MFS transporter [Desulfobacteraceae bacterium]